MTSVSWLELRRLKLLSICSRDSSQLAADIFLKLIFNEDRSLPSNNLNSFGALLNINLHSEWILHDDRLEELRHPNFHLALAPSSKGTKSDKIFWRIDEVKFVLINRRAFSISLQPIFFLAIASRIRMFVLEKHNSKRLWLCLLCEGKNECPKSEKM